MVDRADEGATAAGASCADRRPTSPSAPAAGALGLVSGLMAGLFGVGGGVVLVPGLTGVLGLSQHQAHATSLAAMILTASAGTVGFAVQGLVAVDAAAVLAVGTVVGALLGARIMDRIPGRQLRIGFALFIVIVAVQLLVGEGPVAGAGRAGAPGFGLAAGAAAGLLSAVMGVGGGVILVPALVLLFGFSQQVAEGTSLAVIVPTAVAGSLMHGRSGHTDWRVGALVGAGGVVGALTGSAAAGAIDGRVLQRLFAVLLVLLAGRMLLRTVRPGRRSGR